MTNARTARAWLLAGLGGDESCSREAFRRGLDQRRRGAAVRHRPGQHVRLLGLGRRPLLDGLGDRPLDDDRGRPGELPRAARRLPRDGRALPLDSVRAQPAGADGAARGLVPQLLRSSDRRGAPVRPVPEAVPGLPAAADDGVERQAGHARRHRRRLRHRSGLLGRAGHERTAFLLPADPSGNLADPLRLHRLLHGRSTHSATITTSSRRTCSHRRRHSPSARRPKRSRAEGTPTRLVPHRVFPGNRPTSDDPRGRADTADRSARSSRSTSTRCSRRA